MSAHPNDLTSITCAITPLGDENLFPAAFLDALTGYDYLVKLMGYSPSDIIVGNSAGENLVCALTRYCTPNVPLPAVRRYLTTTPHDGSSTISNTADYLEFHDSGRSFYSKHTCGLGFTARTSPASVFPSDVQAHFQTFPRTFIATGTADIFYDAIRTLRNKVGGRGQVAYSEIKDVWYTTFSPSHSILAGPMH